MITLSIPDMSCGHCSASVQQALGALPGVSGIVVDLNSRTVTVDAAPAPQALIAALDGIGFPASLI
ncbi:heavy-metal-associated domain-containing protein [Rhodobacter ferrooxidans]|uniref:Heavy metal transport/detoxification protein n=1 Tax=Rhodobacter ferrooxidans TaxID=371731 RepID=C8S3U6_9RHOB|nr:heavy metal-associated domain-containing protein [Rhodobacter sp. SW2]EEW24315.1 Heavy metal transport/detoxification protein [Rhodobacter sp. SW2]